MQRLNGGTYCRLLIKAMWRLLVYLREAGFAAVVTPVTPVPITIPIRVYIDRLGERRHWRH